MTRFSLLALLAIATAPCFAGVKTDGTLRPAQTLTGPTFTIDAALGRQVGPNLFHSFGQFDLSAGQSATFTGPNSVHNVLARVTGGPSTIDGALRCTIPQANLYLVNPAGVVFGPNASLDVKGSFAVSTADYVKLGTDGQFHAASPGKSVLTASAPAAFGFLGKHAPAAITVNGALTVGSDPPVPGPGTRRLLAVAGGVHLTGGALNATEGSVGIASVASAGQATIDPANAVVGVSSFSKLGAVTLSDGHVLTQGAPGGTGIAVRADSLDLSGVSSISAQAVNHASVGGTDIVLNGGLHVGPDSSINSIAHNSDTVGGISIEAASATVEGKVLSTAAATGHAGDIAFDLTGPLTLPHGAQVTVTASDATTAGGISISAASLTLGGLLSTVGSATGVAGGITADLTGPLTIAGGEMSTTSIAAGHVGGVTVRAASASVSSVGKIGVDGGDSGSAGGIALRLAGALALDGAGSAISAKSKSGGVTLRAASASITDGAKMSVDSAFVTSTGGIDLALDGPLVLRGGTISEQMSNSGTVGGISITASSATLSAGGQITKSATHTGASIGIDLSVTGALTLSGRNTEISVTGRNAHLQGITLAAGTATITDRARVNTTANFAADVGGIDVSVAGLLDMNQGGGIAVTGDSFALGGTTVHDINVRAGHVSLASGATISCNVLANITAGNIAVDGRSITLDGSGTNGRTGIFIEGALAADGAANIRLTASKNGPISIAHNSVVQADSYGPSQAGRILLEGGSVALSGGSSISASSFVGGESGKILIIAGDVRMSDHATIFANSYRSGTGGAVRIQTDALTMEQSSSISATGGGGVEGTFGTTIDSTAVTSGSPEVAVTLTSGRGTVVPLLRAGDTGHSAHFEDDDANPASHPRGGFLRSFIGNDVRSGEFTLEIRTIDPNASATLSGWSLQIGQRTYHATGLPASGPDIRATIKVDKEPGLTGGIGGNIDIGGRTTDAPPRVAVSGNSSIVSSTLGTDHAGNVKITAGRLSLVDGSINSTSDVPGDAGDVTINAKSISVSHGGTISARGEGTGNAGDLKIDASGAIDVRGRSTVEVSARGSKGGSVSLAAGTTLRLFDRSLVSAESGGGGGNVTIIAGDLIHISASTVTAQSGGAGGHITLDPPIVVLSNGSVINGLSRGQPVIVEIVASSFLKSFDSVILTNANQQFPQTDVNGAIIVLRNVGLAHDAQLAAECGQKFGGTQSSFMVIGRGGSEPQPGGWLPSIDVGMLTPAPSAAEREQSGSR